MLGQANIQDLRESVRPLKELEQLLNTYETLESEQTALTDNIESAKLRIGEIISELGGLANRIASAQVALRGKH